jgi:anti-sigma factor RsiW
MTNHAMTDSVMTKHMMRTQTEPEDMRAQALSALIDGELSDDKAAQTIKHLEQDATAHLAEYLAIGDAMRGLSGQRSGFTQGVMAALKDEPAILAPIRKPTNRRPALWLAAATMAAISWSLWQSNPRILPKRSSPNRKCVSAMHRWRFANEIPAEWGANCRHARGHILCTGFSSR